MRHGDDAGKFAPSVGIHRQRFMSGGKICSGIGKDVIDAALGEALLGKLARKSPGIWVLASIGVRPVSVSGPPHNKGQWRAPIARADAAAS